MESLNGFITVRRNFKALKLCTSFASSISLLLIILACISNHSNAQIVSHELRKLAVSTNQFGLDVLRALDRIEAPDKVLVFCPVCLSSSLIMIMMGSSKYSVVSSLRHALYVWSMKPHEINRGFKDVFEHIGLNQQLQPATKVHQTASLSAETKLRHSISGQTSSKSESFNGTRIRSRETEQLDHILEPIASTNRYLSLPRLMKVKEYLDRSTKGEPWWHSVGGRHDSSEASIRELKEAPSSNLAQRSDRHEATFKNTVPYNRSVSNEKLGLLELGDASQMSAISSIYVQRGLVMNYNYNLLLRQYYKTVIHPVDFVRNGEETRQHINSFVAANTEGKIKDFIRKGNFESATSPRILIISTFHFRGTLDIQIKAPVASNSQKNKLPSSNQPSADNSIRRHQDSPPKNPKEPVFIETEETLLKYGTFSNLDCTVIEIPFNNRLVSLIIVMPNHYNSTELLLTKLSAQVLNDMINSLVVKKVSIEIPVIKFDRGPINVSGMLSELSLDGLFFGNKAHTTETGLNKWMRPSDIVHETSIDIGTINPNWSQIEDRLKVGAHENRSTDSTANRNNHIKLEKPFFYFVLDSINGLVLTMGRIRQ